MSDPAEDELLLQKTLESDIENYFFKASEIAIKYFSQRTHETCYNVLKRMEQLLISEQTLFQQNKLNKSKKPQFIAILYNNLGCYFIRNKINEGYQYLKKAQGIEDISNEEDFMKAITNLNIGLADFKLKKYSFRVPCYKKSLESGYLTESLINRANMIKRKDPNSSITKLLTFQLGLKILLSDDLNPMKYNEHTLSSICLYDIGISLEKLDMQKEAYNAFKKGFSLLSNQHQNSKLKSKLSEKIKRLQPESKTESSNIEFETMIQKIIVPRIRSTSRINEVSRRTQRDAGSQDNDASNRKDSQDSIESKRQRVSPLRLQSSDMHRVSFSRTPVHIRSRDSPNESFLLPSISFEKAKSIDRGKIGHGIRLLKFRRENGSRENIKDRTSIEQDEQALSFSKTIQPENFQAGSKQYSFELINTGPKKPAKYFNGGQFLTKSTIFIDKNKWVKERKSSPQTVVKLTHQPVVTRQGSMEDKKKEGTIHQKKQFDETSINNALDLAQKLLKRTSIIQNKLDLLQSLNNQANKILNELDSNVNNE